MAELTREQVIAMVKARKSLAGKDLSGLNLSGIDLYCADLNDANLYQTRLGGANLRIAKLSRTNLNRADLFMSNLTEANLSEACLREAYLFEANLRGSNLHSVNFEGADLSGADLTGANIWNIATADWKINGIKCEYVYNCKNFWNEEEKKKTRRNFKPGEFEQIYKQFPRIELIFKEEFSSLDHYALLAVIDRINKELPNANLELRKIERTGYDTTATLSTKTSEIVEGITEKSLLQHYERILDELGKIKRGSLSTKIKKE
jgi:hypothetical protein